MQVLNGEEWTEISYSTLVFTKLPRFRLFMLTSDLVYNNISFCERTAKGEMTVSRIGKTRTKPWINNWHNYPACGMHSRPRRIYPGIKAITENIEKTKVNETRHKILIPVDWYMLLLRVRRQDIVPKKQKMKYLQTNKT